MLQITPQNPALLTDPEPLPLPDLPPVAKLPEQALPKAIGDFVFDTAERMQCPPDFVTVVAYCALSTVIGNKIRVQPKVHDNWELTPNLWGALIGRPSSMKSPAMKAALVPLQALEAQYREAYEVEVRDHGAEIELAEITSKAAKDAAKKALKAGNKDVARQTLMDGMAQPEKPVRKRLIVNDTTMEKLADLMNQNPEGLLQVRDELTGLLAKLNRDDAKDERAFYLETFDGNGHFTVDRIGRGTIDIQSTTLSIIGGIQPSKLAPLIRGAINGSSDDGLMQRFQLAVWPDTGGHWDYTDRPRNPDAFDQYQSLFHQLADMKKAETPIRFSDNAQALFIEWYTEIQREARSGDLHPALESHLVKLPKALAAIALINELAENREPLISAEAMARALEFMDYLRTHAERIYSIATQGGVEGAKRILRRRDQLPPCFKPRDIQRKGWAGLTTKEEVAAALEVLMDHHYIHKAWPEPESGRFAFRFSGRL